MHVVNDDGCSWINDLDRRSNIKTLDKDKSCDWLIIGAGYTGLSAARKLSELHPNQKIIIVDAQLAGEGASGRNSGYLVDTTLNDGFTSNKELSNYKKKTDIYKLGIDVVKKFIKEHQVDCDWNESGKYFASSNQKDRKILENFSKTLSKLNFGHNILEKDSLGNRYSISLNKPKGSFEKQVIERVYKLVLHGIIEEKKSISCSELDLIKLQKSYFLLTKSKDGY